MAGKTDNEDGLKLGSRWKVKQTRVLSWRTYDTSEEYEEATKSGIEIRSLDIPGGGPSTGFLSIQDHSMTSLSLTRKAFLEANKAHKMLVFHRIEVDLMKQMQIAFGRKGPSDQLDSVTLLLLEEVSSALRDAIVKRLVERFGPEYALYNGLLADSFAEDRAAIGDAIFSVMPGLGAISWRLPVDSSPIPRAVCVRSGELISSVKHFVKGSGERELPWRLTEDETTPI